MQIVQASQTGVSEFFSPKQMVQIGFRMAFASITGAIFVNRGIIQFIGRVFDRNFASMREKGGVSGVSGGHHAIKHIHP